MTAEEVVKIRKELGMSQKQFAQRIGLGPFNVTVSRWEHGHVKPSRLAEKAIRELVIRVEQEKDAQEAETIRG